MKTRWAATAASGDALRIYLVTSDGTNPDGTLSAADAELTSETPLLNNCQFIGAVVSAGVNQVEVSQRRVLDSRPLRPSRGVERIGDEGADEHRGGPRFHPHPDSRRHPGGGHDGWTTGLSAEFPSRASPAAPRRASIRSCGTGSSERGCPRWESPD